MILFKLRSNAGQARPHRYAELREALRAGRVAKIWIK